MIRLIFLLVLIGGAYSLVWRQSEPLPRMPATLEVVPTPATPMVPVGVHAPAVPIEAPIVRSASSAPPATSEVSLEGAKPVQNPAPPRQRPQIMARSASPIPTSSAPEAPLLVGQVAVETPLAGAVPREPVLEILPDGSSRPAGGPSNAAPPLVRRIPRPAASAQPQPEPVTIPPSTPPAAIESAPRPNQADRFLRNAARILAETEIPK